VPAVIIYISLNRLKVLIIRVTIKKNVIGDIKGSVICRNSLHLIAPCENIPRFLIILVYDRPHYTTTVQMLKHNTTVMAGRAYVIHPQEIHFLLFLPIDDATGPDAAHSCFQHSLARRWHIK